jgi:hypothetical protein
MVDSGHRHSIAGEQVPRVMLAESETEVLSSHQLAEFHENEYVQRLDEYVEDFVEVIFLNYNSDFK